MTLDDDYANSAHIPGGDGYYAQWDAAAEAFRASHKDKTLGVKYGARDRQIFDMFRPSDAAKGTVIFVHGGYWVAGSAGMFSHLAAGAVAAGFNCAMPSYTLAPDAQISDITVETAAAITAIASQTQGPLYLTGHSAGGHLVARMACSDMAKRWTSRVARIMPISPLSDLSPLMQTSMNAQLGLDAVSANLESPVSYAPLDVPVTIWVGEAERPAFLDHARWLSDKWQCDLVVDEGKHHFDVIEGLEQTDSAMMRALLS